MKLHHHFVCCLIRVLNGVYSLINGTILIWYRYIRVRLSQSCLITNHRGISLLDVLSKVFEKVYDELFNSVKPHICKCQYKFLPRRSTVSQLIQVVCGYAKALQQVDVIYLLRLCFAKAFDKVPHNKLLFKLESLGIRGNLLAWFQSYLSGRRHRVVINGKASDYLQVTSDVPQGPF